MDSKYRIELADNSKGSANSNTNSINSSLGTVIKVIGVGNGGCNAVNRMIEEGLDGVEFVAMNTDKQALSRSNAETKIVLGERITQGLGAGTDPEKGAEAAREDSAKIEEIIKGANLVFIASSFGGGTGTGASPIVAEISKNCGALTIGVITKPFKYEGKLKMKRAEAGIEKMFTVVDSLIIIPNENLYDMVDAENYGYSEAFSIIDDILRQGVQGISDIITKIGFGVNVDFADVKAMIDVSKGRAHLGIGIGKGENRIEKAIKNAFENPLLDVANIRNSKGILANIVMPKDFRMKEFEKASEIISTYASEEANIKIGTCQDENLSDEIRVTIVATGFDANLNKNEDTEKKDYELSKNDIKNDNINNNEDNNSNEIITGKLEDINLTDKIEIENKNDFTKERVISKASFRKITLQDKSINAINDYSENKNENVYNDINIENNEIENFNDREELAEKSEYTIFNKNIIDNQTDKSAASLIDRNEEYNNHLVETDTETKKDNEISKPIFDVMSDDEMKIHNDMGAKNYIFGASANSSTDVDETPAYLRRGIVARNVIK